MQENFPKNTFQKTIEVLSPELGLQESEALAYLTLEKIYNLSKTDLIVNRPYVSNGHQTNKYNQLIKRLLSHEPIQYILNEAEFYGFQFYVNGHVLIPRQETELLIQIIENFRPWRRPKMADIGTGSGCIACTLALTIEGAELNGYDVSPEALKVAQQNAKRLGARAAFEVLDILNQDIPLQNLDLVVSNPPYVMEEEKQQMNKNVLDFEPSLALFVSNHDPLIFYNTIAQKAKSALKKGGALFFEINEQFGKETLFLLERMGYGDPKLYQDLNGKDRFASGILI
ncbi:peptide chain release factor N(5)-glutamine methyltransferase [Reichenbachiella carrageenanivorans]|uniref:peptide chain release factor N(5)-glutamine methyltransferase n=1 Tax=Reichenbachiella carrageenanivorans TaxID=2979869 RepID=A0ABY6D3P6_9BACT|nr:peptide chain release factor N(5)-glutamine methyltransferase [Reichenbachiella carrageenanivorans]UXX80777.1 peptide chain release factor N(5)-glutamine methyltransferase [Reichenbachiella carrageenanivorans]